MSYERLAYDDADNAGKMHEDCTACGDSIALPLQRTDDVLPGTLADVLPELRKDTKPQIEVSDAAAYLASRLHLHLD